MSSKYAYDLIVFDLDGVLVDSREIHFHALNDALTQVAGIEPLTKNEHLSTYDGLPTRTKLKLLSERKGLDPSLHDTVWRLKQEYTKKYITENIRPDPKTTATVKAAFGTGIRVAVASNAVHSTVKHILHSKGLLQYVDFYLSNNNVSKPKPHPEIYLKAMLFAGTEPSRTLVVEDSHVGREAVHRSGATLCAVSGVEEVNPDRILAALNPPLESRKTIPSTPWEGKVNVVIPMAGEGSRFASKGYTFPKPLIDVGRGKPMIQAVVDNLNMGSNAHFIFIVRKSHNERWNIRQMLQIIRPGCTVIETDGLTQGAACSILLARDHINNDTPLLLANSDQFLEWDANRFMYAMQNVDAGISTFHSTHPRWSYAAIDEKTGFVNRVAEKNPISTHATTGIYYWAKGRHFVQYADQMIAADRRVRGEFYTCPVFNEAIQGGLKVKALDCERMWGLGIPEDLETFIKSGPL